MFNYIGTVHCGSRRTLRISMDELMDKNLPYFVEGNLATLTLTHSLCSKQVRVQLPTSADKVALLASAAGRRAAAAPGGDRSIDVFCPPGAQQQTRRTGMQRSIDGTDRQTDGRTPDRSIEPAVYYASSDV